MSPSKLRTTRAALYDALAAALPRDAAGAILRSLDEYLYARDAERKRDPRAELEPIPDGDNVVYIPPQQIAAILTDLLPLGREADTRTRLFKLLAQLSGSSVEGMMVRGRIEYNTGRFYVRIDSAGG